MNGKDVFFKLLHKGREAKLTKGGGDCTVREANTELAGGLMGQASRDSLHTQIA